MSVLDKFFLDLPTTLIYGIGNIGRQDDGLGWAFVDRLKATRCYKQLNLYKFYQLNIEDAELISRKERVLFVDAYKGDELEHFSIKRINAARMPSFSSHALGAEAVVAICENLYQKYPECYYLAIRGYEWGLKEGLSKRARANLDAAMTTIFAPERMSLLSAAGFGYTAKSPDSRTYAGG